jgi:hypothetical protein
MLFGKEASRVVNMTPAERRAHPVVVEKKVVVVEKKVVVVEKKVVVVEKKVVVVVDHNYGGQRVVAVGYNAWETTHSRQGSGRSRL